MIDPNRDKTNVTLQITDGCNLNCSYCYQVHKGHNLMDINTGKKIIDLLFNLYDKDDRSFPINKTTDYLDIYFIGGEPLLNVPLIQNVSDYFVEQCTIRKHPWNNNFNFRVCTNGLLYFNQDFQNYLKQHHEHLAMEISIDGKESGNNVCRNDINGNGSFNYALDAIHDYKQRYNDYLDISMVISPQNLPYLNEVYDFLLDNECYQFDIGPILDYKWTLEEGREYYKQLVLLADRMIERPGLILPMFSLRYYNPMNKADFGSCAGTNRHGLIFGPNGKAYTCLRFMSCSQNNIRPSLCIGNCNNIYSTDQDLEIDKKLTSINKKTHYNDQCLQCQIAEGCSKCAAIFYDDTGDFIDTNLNFCWMHRAASLANVYFWNMVSRLVEKPERVPILLDRESALQIVSEDEYNFLINLSKEG